VSQAPLRRARSRDSRFEGDERAQKGYRRSCVRWLSCGLNGAFGYSGETEIPKKQPVFADTGPGNALKKRHFRLAMGWVVVCEDYGRCGLVS